MMKNHDFDDNHGSHDDGDDDDDDDGDDADNDVDVVMNTKLGRGNVERLSNPALHEVAAVVDER